MLYAMCMNLGNVVGQMKIQCWNFLLKASKAQISGMGSIPRTGHLTEQKEQLFSFPFSLRLNGQEKCCVPKMSQFFFCISPWRGQTMSNTELLPQRDIFRLRLVRALTSYGQLWNGLHKMQE